MLEPGTRYLDAMAWVPAWLVFYNMREGLFGSACHGRMYVGRIVV